jgi:hypothetical protein
LPARAGPYGVYDIAANQGRVNVGIDDDTAAFAVESTRRWLRRMTADCGRSNGARVRLWKLELQKLANHTGLAITVAHHPLGTSKWKRIEHRMFAFVSQNWRGKPLLTRSSCSSSPLPSEASISSQCLVATNGESLGVRYYRRVTRRALRTQGRLAGSLQALYRRRQDHRQSVQAMEGRSR